MKWDRHFVIGLVFAVPGALLALISYGSSPFCGGLVGRSSSCGYLIDYETLSIGTLLAFLALGEFVLAYKRKKEGEMFWESDSQRGVRRTGMIAMLIGALTSLVTYFKVNNTPALAPWNVAGVYGISFYVGLFVVAFGAGLIFGSRFFKIKPMKAAADRALYASA